jgi:hypothetical protein
LARTVLTRGSEAWTIKKADEDRLFASKMKFMRKTACCTLLAYKQKEAFGRIKKI